MEDKDLNKDHTLIGKMVSSYHYISRDPGRIYHTKGKSDPYGTFQGGCVFIEHGSGYMITKQQVDIKDTEIVKAKLTFEIEAQSQGVVIKGYHTNNGILSDSEFMEELLNKQKYIRFTVFGDSHQNGAS